MFRTTKCFMGSLLLACLPLLAAWPAQALSLPETVPTSELSDDVYLSQAPRLEKALEEEGLMFGAPIYVRVFKASRELELHVLNGDSFQLFRTYPICRISGGLGPKLEQGDEQAPEGFYSVSAEWLNPESIFHLSFNIGYPNTYDEARGRTGSLIMVHGGCESKGCFAMTNHYIEEIYTLAEAALRHSQRRFDVHVFPFRMTDENMHAYRHSSWYDFWRELKPGFDYFEAHGYPPHVRVNNGRYIID